MPDRSLPPIYTRGMLYTLYACAAGMLLSAGVLLFVGCTQGCRTAGSTNEGRVRTALDAFNLAASPAWATVNEACLYRQRAINAEAQAGRITVDEARRQIAPVRARCHVLTDVFRAMREAHDQAAELVEAGKVQEAEVWLIKLRERWRDYADLEDEADAPADAGAPAEGHPMHALDAGGAL